MHPTGAPGRWTLQRPATEASRSTSAAAARLASLMPTFVHAGQRLAYEVYGEGRRNVVLLPGLLFPSRMHEPLAPRPRGPRQPRDHARPARARRIGQAARHVALLDADLRPRGRGAARPPGDRRGRDRRHLAGREHDARGRVAGADPRARHGDRDAGARQRAARVRDRVHAAADLAHVRRADHRARGLGAAPRAARVRPLPGRLPRLC